ncbi:hypothetical protein [uncultured Chitinophaga sp.]|uniref:hypothetical protein n=1 Tax=uncultured Chitinophaga sp. TaxID=339340 RepID=UPI0025F4DB02|nr:hypothetical protein [uncultured Chitinophaga sp.]
MTYQEKHDELLMNADKAWKQLLETDRNMVSTTRFGDMDSVSKYNQAYTRWQEAANEYNKFISFINGKAINPNDEAH